MASRITQKLTLDIREVSCDDPFFVVWFDRKGRPGVWAFERHEYQLDTRDAERYNLPLQASHTLRGMVAAQSTLREAARERVQVWTDFVIRENAIALDEIRHAQIVLRYDPAEVDYLQWRRIYPLASPSNPVSGRWGIVPELTLAFEFEPQYNF